MNPWELIWSFLQVGMFSVGGGYVAIPLIQAKAVTEHGWLSLAEFTDLVTIAEMTPGPIALNAATFVGFRLGGLPAALMATLSCITPSLIIVSLLSWVYQRYKGAGAMQAALACLRPAVVALIASAALSILSMVFFGGQPMSLEAVQWVGVALFVAALLALRKGHINPIVVMLSCGAVNLVIAWVSSLL